MLTSADPIVVHLVGRIYEVVPDPSGWPALLQETAAAVRADAGVLILGHRSPDRDDARIAVGMPVDPDAGYARFFAESPGLARFAAAAPSGAVIPVSALVPEDAFFASRFYREWLEPRGLRHVLACLLHRTPDHSSGLALLRAKGEPPFGEAEAGMLQQLAPHLERAIQVHEALSDAALASRAAAEALDALQVAAFVTRRDGRIVPLNRRAAALLSERDGLTLGDRGLRAGTPRDSAALRRLLVEAIATSRANGTGSGGVLALRRPSGRPPLQALVSPMRLPEAIDPGLDGAAAVLLVRDPGAPALPSADQLRQRYALTPAEVRVALRLGAGETLAEIATRLGLGLSTVRTHLKQIFEKTGTHRQAELVRLLLGQPLAAKD